MYKWLYLGKTDKKPQKESNRSKYLDRVTDNSVQAREHPDAKFSIHINGQTKRNIKITIVLKTIPTTWSRPDQMSSLDMSWQLKKMEIFLRDETRANLSSSSGSSPPLSKSTIDDATPVCQHCFVRSKSFQIRSVPWPVNSIQQCFRSASRRCGSGSYSLIIPSVFFYSPVWFPCQHISVLFYKKYHYKKSVLFVWDHWKNRF